MRAMFLRLDRLRADCRGSLQYSSLALLLAIAAIAILGHANGHIFN
jgi:hypothetical protein